MSHLSVMSAEIRDLEAVKAMCKRMGWEFRQGQKQYKWYGRFVGDTPMPQGFTVNDLGKCDHAIRIPGASYEVGIVKRGDKYVFMLDYWQGGGLTKHVGPKGEILSQMYGVEATKLACKRKRKACREERLPNGTIRLRVGA